MPIGASKNSWITRKQDQYDPEAELGTPSATQTAGVWTLGEISAQDSVLAFDAIFPTTPSDGCLAEKGGTTFGLWLGLTDSGATFRVRSGAGGSVPNSGTALIDITDFPQDGELHTVVVELDVGTGVIMRVWIDGELKGTDSGTAGQPAGSGSGGFLTGVNTNVSGEPTAAWPGGTSEGEARLYSNTLVP